MRIEGKGIYIDSLGKQYSIKGHGNLPEHISLQSLQVSGNVSFEKISCDELKVKGKCRGTLVTAKNISVSGSFEVDSVKVENVFKVSGSVEIKNLDVTEIVMESRGGSIGEIKCDNIKIFHSEDFNSGEILSKIFGEKTSNKTSSRVKIKNISAEKVDLQNCEVEEIKCKDAFINSNCVIKKLIVEGDCEISEDSKVGETVRG